MSKRLVCLTALLLLGALLPAAACRRAAATDFQPTFDTREAAAEAVLDALWQRDTARLETLAVSETEFRKYVWPRLPATAAGAGESVDYWWQDLRTRSLGALARTVEEHGGRRMVLEAVSFEGDVADYGTFRVHREASLVVREVDGSRREMRLFGSMIETSAGWKIYSFVID